ncbi:MAG: hypothetical protein ACRDDF_01685 [Aeromonas sp.]
MGHNKYPNTSLICPSQQKQYKKLKKEVVEQQKSLAISPEFLRISLINHFQRYSHRQKLRNGEYLKEKHITNIRKGTIISDADVKIMRKSFKPSDKDLKAFEDEDTIMLNTFINIIEDNGFMNKITLEGTDPESQTRIIIQEIIKEARRRLDRNQNWGSFFVEDHNIHSFVKNMNINSYNEYINVCYFGYLFEYFYKSSSCVHLDILFEDDTKKYLKETYKNLFPEKKWGTGQVSFINPQQQSSSLYVS